MVDGAAGNEGERCRKGGTGLLRNSTIILLAGPIADEELLYRYFNGGPERLDVTTNRAVTASV